MKAFITGTDTGVGKTYATVLLTRALRSAGLDTVALKPVCCGDRDDAESLRAAADNDLSLDEVNPFWLQMPVAPRVAAKAEGREIAIDGLVEWFGSVVSARRSVLVEGAGGWLVPLAEGVTMADLAVRLSLPVVVVVANRLGCLNHALLTVESIRHRGLTCAGLILNTISPVADDATRTNRAMLEETAGVPVLLEIAPGQKQVELALA